MTSEHKAWAICISFFIAGCVIIISAFIISDAYKFNSSPTLGGIRIENIHCAKDEYIKIDDSFMGGDKPICVRKN